MASPRLTRLFDVRSLSVRLVLAMVLAASLPLLVGVAVISSTAEASAINHGLADHRIAAKNVAQAVDHYRNSYTIAVGTIATRGNLLSLSRDEQRSLLRGLLASDVLGWSIYSATGQAEVRSDDRPARDLPQAFLDQIRSSGAPIVSMGRVPGSDDPELMFAAPLLTADGQVGGVVAAEVPTSAVARMLQNLTIVQLEGAQVMLVDTDGRVLAHPDPNIMSARADFSQLAPVKVALGAVQDSGATQFQGDGGAGYLAGYARVPTLGWIALVQSPTDSLLAGVSEGRQAALVVLVIAGLISGGIGVIVARRFVQPLTTLVLAAESVAQNDNSTPLRRSGFPEIQRLTEAFALMRARLAVRTAETERALAAAHDAARVREEFLSVAAHELKTPVTSVRGYAQVLLSRVEHGQQPTKDDLLRALRRIDTQSHKLQRLTQELLDVARLETGRLEVQRLEADLRNVLIDAVAASPHRERVDLSLPDDPQIALVDTLRLEQVLGNLLDNAAKFSPKNGRVGLTLEPTAPRKARIAVCDTGVGIPPEHRDRIFERFYQAHSDSHRSGLGLGLYIAKQIVDLHEGCIRAESVSNNATGTRFVIDLPTSAGA